MSKVDSRPYSVCDVINHVGGCRELGGVEAGLLVSVREEFGEESGSGNGAVMAVTRRQVALRLAITLVISRGLLLSRSGSPLGHLF